MPPAPERPANSWGDVLDEPEAASPPSSGPSGPGLLDSWALSAAASHPLSFAAAVGRLPAMGPVRQPNAPRCQNLLLTTFPLYQRCRKLNRRQRERRVTRYSISKVLVRYAPLRARVWLIACCIHHRTRCSS